jgi:hypothetical protein
MRVEERLDTRSACAAFEPRDRALVADEHERRDVADPEVLRERRLVVDIDPEDPDTPALLPTDLREHALHAAARARTRRHEEQEQRRRGSVHRRKISALGSSETGRETATTLAGMWEWYRIGVAAGIGAGAGLLAAGWLARSRAAGAALLVGAAVGVVVGFLLDDWTEALAGAIGGVLGGFGSIQIVRGALRRGGTAGGTGILVGLAGLGVAALALVPVVGYLEALALPSLGARLRRRRPERYAGLRSLARD